MRKQTKLVAVLSASALLAMGASMTSFAATGWTQEDGTWYYYDRDGSRVTDEWKKSGNYWFWLDDDGEMATDMLVEDDDDYYYVDVNGVMVTNRWVAVDNEDAGDEDEPDQYWYYFQSNGKAMKGSDSGNVRFKTINGKKYAFDEEGKMLYGWVSEDGERQTGDEDWKEEAVYYLGDENDGAMATGWRLINILDENWTDENEYDEKYDDDQDRWFYFKSNGRRYFGSDEKIVQKTINGKKYGFDEYGRMVAEWHITEGTASVASQSDANYTREWAYFSSPEDGARKTKGWFKVMPDYYLDQEKYDDAEEFWYYGDGKGQLYANEIKTINGKKYAFDEYGRMMDGLRLVYFAENGNYISTSKIDMSWKDDDDDSLLFDTEDNLDATIKSVMEKDDAAQYAFMYFGDEDDGSLKTGKQTIDIDGDRIDFEFNKSGSKKGQGRNEVDDSDKVIYAMGKKFKADSDNKYEIVFELETGSLVSLSVQDYIAAANLGQHEVLDSKGEEVEEIYYAKTADPKDCLITEYEDVKVIAGSIRVVNASGTMVKTKSKAKDGDDYILKVNNRDIQKIYTEED